MSSGVLRWNADVVELTRRGRHFLLKNGIDVASLEKGKRPLCRTCIDWSERQHHLGGAVGAAVMSHALEKGWASREAGHRTVIFSRRGEDRFTSWYAGRSARDTQQHGAKGTRSRRDTRGTSPATAALK